MPCPFEFIDVSFTYPGYDGPSVQNINLKIEEGEFVGITGPTACGKSTLLLIMSGAIPHYLPGLLEGDVLVYGKRIQDLTLAEITEKVGLVMQDPEAQLFNLLVRDEIVWGLENRGILRPLMLERMDEALRFFNISFLRERITNDLSGGEKQKVALASIYACKTETILLDNPTSQLDPIGSIAVFEAIRRITQAKNHTVIMVEDKIDELVEHCDRMILMANGEIKIDGTPELFCKQSDLLDSVGVFPPAVTLLTSEIVKSGISMNEFPITLDEAVKVYSQMLKKGEVSIHV